MSRVVLLDTMYLGMITHPRRNPEVKAWLSALVAAGARVVVPEIADYELRRELLLQGLTRSLKRLDELKEQLDYEPLTTSIMLKAAEYWAQVRAQGKATADDKGLDGDMILAAQWVAITNDGQDVVIATDNVKHLGLVARARSWREIT